METDFPSHFAVSGRGGRRRQSERSQKFSIAPSWMGAKLDLAYELGRVTQVQMETGGEAIERVRELLAVVEYAEMTPVIVLDDTDRWLSTEWQPDSMSVRNGFFGRIVRLLGEELGTAVSATPP